MDFVNGMLEALLIVVVLVVIYKVLRICCACICKSKREPQQPSRDHFQSSTHHQRVPSTTINIDPPVPVHPRYSYRRPKSLPVHPPPSIETATPSSPCECPDVITGVVTYVGDGDGFRLFHSCPGKAPLKDTLNIRLAGIDAPEMAKKNQEGQPFSKESKQFLFKLVYRKELLLEKLGIDQYGRILAMAYLPDRENKENLTALNNINLALVSRGMALVFTGRDAVYGRFEQELWEAEAEAKRLKKGLWDTDEEVVTPMEFKKLQRTRSPQRQPIRVI